VRRIGPEFWLQSYKSTWGLSEFSWAEHLPDLTVSEVAFLGFVVPMLITIVFKYVRWQRQHEACHG